MVLEATILDLAVEHGRSSDVQRTDDVSLGDEYVAWFKPVLQQLTVIEVHLVNCAEIQPPILKVSNRQIGLWVLPLCVLRRLLPAHLHLTHIAYRKRRP